jgi:hypothetical protein
MNVATCNLVVLKRPLSTTAAFAVQRRTSHAANIAYQLDTVLNLSGCRHVLILRFVITSTF